MIIDAKLCKSNDKKDAGIFKYCQRELQIIVNSQKRTVTVILSNTSLDAIKRVRRGLEGEAVAVNPDGSIMDIDDFLALSIPDKFVATARCSADDIFDVDEGIKIAKKKVYEKYDKARLKAYNRYLQLLKHRVEAVESIINESR